MGAQAAWIEATYFAKPLKRLVHPTRFERVTSAFGGIKTAAEMGHDVRCNSQTFAYAYWTDIGQKI